MADDGFQIEDFGCSELLEELEQKAFDQWWEHGWTKSHLEARAAVGTDTSFDELKFWSPTSFYIGGRLSYEESNEWGSQYWTEFPKGSNQFWDPFHLPLFDRNGTPSPKNMSYVGPEKWTKAEWEKLERGLQFRLSNVETRPEEVEILRLPSRGRPIEFRYSKPGRQLMIAGVVFGAPITIGEVDNTSFINCIFYQHLQIHGAAVHRIVEFRNCCFDGVELDGYNSGPQSLLLFDRCSIAKHFEGKTDTHQSIQLALQDCYVGEQISFPNDTQLNVRVSDTVLADNLSARMYRGELHVLGSIVRGNTSVRTDVAKEIRIQDSMIVGSSVIHVNAVSRLALRDSSFLNTVTIKSDASTKRPMQLIVASSDFLESLSLVGGVLASSSTVNGCIFGDVFSTFGMQLNADADLTGNSFAIPPGSNFIPKPRSDYRALAERVASEMASRHEHRSRNFGKADSLSPRNTVVGQFESAYRNLKIQMEDLRARQAETFFHGLEIESQMRRDDVSAWDRFAAGLYKATTDYGQSISRPFILLLVGCPLFFACAYYLLIVVATGEFGPFEPSDYGTMAWFVFERSINPIAQIDYSATLELRTAQEQTPFAFGLLNSLHRLTAVVLAFLIALAIRRRFQIS